MFMEKMINYHLGFVSKGYETGVLVSLPERGQFTHILNALALEKQPYTNLYNLMHC